MDSIKIKSLEPIESAEINFGDLTLFVGPQASGKSILLQMIKLLNDKQIIHDKLNRYGFVWGNAPESVLERYFGEGMSGIWNNDTEIQIDNTIISKASLLSVKTPTQFNDEREQVFYIPAQRIVCLQNGWPRYFTEYEDSVPYVMRDFSETLRQFLESGTDQDDGIIFPQTNNGLKDSLNESFNNSIFHDGKVILDQAVKKRFKLNIGNSSIPYMAWSAGQKEFMPLLLSFYWLCPPSKKGRLKSIKYIIIEEPEMGLHPQAIESVILQVIDLMSRGYKIILSTHSPVFLEFAWAFKYLKEMKAEDKSLYELFNMQKSEGTEHIFKEILEDKSVNTYYFDRKDNKVIVRDISSLDAGSEDQSVADWGGLSSFSSKASDLISRIMSKDL